MFLSITNFALWEIGYALNTVWFFPAQAFTYTVEMNLLVGRASGPTKITDPEFESLSSTLISCHYHRPLLGSLGLCSPNAGLVPHSCPPLITQLRSPEEVVQDVFCQHSFPHRPSPGSFVTVNCHQSYWIMIGESQKCYLCCRSRAPSLSLFPACVKMESLIFVLAPPALVLEVKHSEFSSFGLGWNPCTDTTKIWFWLVKRQPCWADTVWTAHHEKPFGTSF